jgi:hypothetical protein
MKEKNWPSWPEIFWSDYKPTQKNLVCPENNLKTKPQSKNKLNTQKTLKKKILNKTDQTPKK